MKLFDTRKGEWLDTVSEARWRCGMADTDSERERQRDLEGLSRDRPKGKRKKAINFKKKC